MFERELGMFRFLRNYAHNLMTDIRDDDLCVRPHPQSTHAAWLLGHLAVVYDRIGDHIGGIRILEERWHELFAPGTTVQDDPAIYPSRIELIEAYDAGHAQLERTVPDIPRHKIDAPNPHQRLAEYLPATGDLIAFVLTAHEATHIGQLSAWRQALGRERLF